MKLKKYMAVASGVLAMLSMQMTAFAEADRDALKTALVEYEWHNYTLPETRAKGIENSADLAWLYTSLDEFFDYYSEEYMGSEPLGMIDVESDYSVRHFYDAWTDFLDGWIEEKEELYGDFSVVDTGDTFQIVDAAGNTVEVCDKLYQYVYLNEEMSEEDREFYLSGEDLISVTEDSETEDEMAASGMEEDMDTQSSNGGSFGEMGSNGYDYNHADSAALDGVNGASDGVNSASNGENGASADSENVTDTDTEQSSEESTTETTEEAETRSAAPYVVGGVVVVAAAGIGGYFLYQKKKKD